MHLLVRREGLAQSIIMALCTQCSGCYVASISPQTDSEIMYPTNRVYDVMPDSEVWTSAPGQKKMLSSYGFCYLEEAEGRKSPPCQFCNWRLKSQQHFLLEHFYFGRSQLQMLRAGDLLIVALPHRLDYFLLRTATKITSAWPLKTLLLCTSGKISLPGAVSRILCFQLEYISCHHTGRISTTFPRSSDEPLIIFH